MTTYGQRTCLICGKSFEAAYAQQVCCSSECQRIRTQQTKNAYGKKKYLGKKQLAQENAELKAEITALREALEKASMAQWNVCERLNIRQMSKLPCGKRPACWAPDKCSKVPRGAKKEDAHEPAEEGRGTTSLVMKRVPKMPSNAYIPVTDRALI